MRWGVVGVVYLCLLVTTVAFDSSEVRDNPAPSGFDEFAAFKARASTDVGPAEIELLQDEDVSPPEQTKTSVRQRYAEPRIPTMGRAQGPGRPKPPGLGEAGSQYLPQRVDRDATRGVLSGLSDNPHCT